MRGGGSGERTVKKAKTTKYRSVAIASDHPLCQKPQGGYGKAYEHRVVLYEKIGEGIHECHWCEKEVSWFGDSRLVADHLDGDRWNNASSNLVASCWRCNMLRNNRPDFLTHCVNGHEFTESNIYYRPDGEGRMCRLCCKARERKRQIRNGQL